MLSVMHLTQNFLCLEKQWASTALLTVPWDSTEILDLYLIFKFSQTEMIKTQPASRKDSTAKF